MKTGLPPRRRHELFAPLSNDDQVSKQQQKQQQCFSLTSSSDWMGSIVQRGSSPAYGVVFLPNGELWKLPHSSEAVSSLSLHSTSADFAYAAVGTTRGNINIYLLDKQHGITKTWLGGRPTTEEIVALEFVTPAANHVLFSFVVLTKKSGSLLTVDVLLDTVNAEDDSSDDASVFSVEGADEPDTDMVTYQLQSSVRVADHAEGEKPTGAMLVMDHEADPRVLLGMNGGTLLVLERICDKVGYSWMPNKKILLPSGVASLALSSDCVNSPKNFTMLAAGLKDGEVALLDATFPTHDASSPPFPPFHFLMAYEDYFVPVSALSFFWSTEKENSRLLMAVASGNLLRIADMSTFEVFYAYRGSLGTIQDVQFVSGSPKVLVAREMYAVEAVTLHPWQVLFGGSLLQAAPVTALAFTGESNCLAMSSGSDVLVCDSSTWLPASGNTVGTVFDRLQLDANVLVQQVAYSPDSRVLAIVTKPKDAPDGDASLCLYTRTGINDSWEPKVKHTVPSKDPTVAFSPTYRYLLMTKDDGFTVFDLGRMHDLGKVATEKNFGDILIEGRPKATKVLAAFSNDGRTLAVARNSSVKFYDGERMVETGFIDIEQGKITSLSFGAKSTHLAIGSSSGHVFVAEYGRGEWELCRSLQCPEGVLSVQFSPNSASPFIAAVTGSANCFVFSTLSWQIVQEVPFDDHYRMSTLTFDRSGTLLVIGGLTSSPFGKLKGGVIVVVHVGEVLRPEWFVTPLDQNKPGNGLALCQKLNSLHSVERSQLLYHKTDGGKLLPLESSIRSAIESITSSGGSGALLGSVCMSFDNPSDLITSWLADLFLAFPKAVFSCTASLGSVVDAAVLRHDQRLLGLVLSTALIHCRSHPYLMMNYEMRTGRLTDALVATTKFAPDCLLDVMHEIALWPVPLYAHEEWKAPAGGGLVRCTLEVPVTDEAFKEAGQGNGVLARPFVLPIPGLSALKFLSSVTRSCGPEVFATQEIAVVIDEIWSKEITPMFLFDCLLRVGLFLTFGCLVSLEVQAAEFQSLSSSEIDLPKGSVVLLMVFVSVFNYLTTVRAVRLNLSAVVTWLKGWFCRPTRTYPVDQSDVLQYTLVVSTWFMVNATLFLSIRHHEWTDSISAATSFLLLIKTLATLRGFECVDLLFRVVWQTIMDLKGFALVAGTILLWLVITLRSLSSAFLVDGQEQIKLSWLFLSLGVILVAVAMSVYISFLRESCAQTQHYADVHKRHKRACLIVSYLERMNKERREVIESRRKYLFALIPVDFADSLDNKGTPRLVDIAKRSDLRKREEDRRQHKQSQMLERQVYALRQTLHEVEEKVSGLYNSSEANLDDMSTRSTDTASIQSRTSFQKRIGPLSQW